MATAADVQVIRNSSLFGRGSCTSYDECYTDEELMTVIQEAKDYLKKFRNYSRTSMKSVMNLFYEQEKDYWAGEGIVWPERS